MALLDAITNIFTGGLAGGITGIIGSISTAIVNYKMKKLEYEHEVQLQKLQMDLKRLDIEAAKAKVQGEISIAAEHTRAESYKSLNKEYFNKSYFAALPNSIKPIIAILFAILDFIRGIIRPFITILVLTLVCWLGYNIHQSNAQAFVTSADLLVEIILYLTVTIVSWWFSDRSIQKYLNNQIQQYYSKSSSNTQS